MLFWKFKLVTLFTDEASSVTSPPIVLSWKSIAPVMPENSTFPSTLIELGRVGIAVAIVRSPLM